MTDGISRRQTLHWGLGMGLMGVALPMLLPGCSTTPPLRLAMHPWPAYLLMLLAGELSPLSHGVAHLVMTQSARESLDALRAGKAVAAALTLDEMLRARASGLPLTAVGVFDASAGADGIVARSAVREVKDLYGKRVGVELRSTGALLLQKALEQAGMQESAIIWVDVPVSEHVTTMKAENLDAMVTYEPHLSQLEMVGFHRIFDSRSVPATIIDVLAVRTDQIGAQRQNLQAVLAAHFRGRGLMLANPVDAGYALSRYFSVPPAKPAAELFSGLMLPGLASNLEYLEPHSGELWAAAQTLTRFLHSTGAVAHIDDLNDLATTRCLPSA